MGSGNSKLKKKTRAEKMRLRTNTPRNSGSSQSVNLPESEVYLSPNTNQYVQPEHAQTLTGNQSSVDPTAEAPPVVPLRTKPSIVPGKEEENRIKTLPLRQSDEELTPPAPPFTPTRNETTPVPLEQKEIRMKIQSLYENIAPPLPIHTKSESWYRNVEDHTDEVHQNLSPRSEAPSVPVKPKEFRLNTLLSQVQSSEGAPSCRSQRIKSPSVNVEQAAKRRKDTTGRL